MECDKVVELDIISLDERITSCIVECPDDIDNEYYVKIWFKYKMNNIIRTDGRQEFISENKSDLIKDIKEFMSEPKNGWVLI